MNIVCGTDLSARARAAADVAAMLAARLGDRLRLVHIVDELGSELTLSHGPSAAIYSPVRSMLHQEARRVREHGVEVEEEFIAGHAPEALTMFASGPDVRFVVMSSLGDKAPARWLLGSVSERVARCSPVPVLVVRSAVPFERWLREGRRLNVMVGARSTESWEGALRWLGTLRRVGACDVIVTSVVSPVREGERLGVEPSPDVEELPVDVERAVLRELREKASGLDGEGDVRFLVVPESGRVDNRLVTIAEEEAVDLVVVEPHRRAGIERFWHESVSRGVLHLAPMSVATVPHGVSAEGRTSVATIERVLVATDFSETGDRAISMALAMLPDGGALHLVHVVPRASGEGPIAALLPVRTLTRDEWARGVQDAHERLAALVPESAARRGVRVAVNILEGNVTDELCRAAERLGADVICLGTHGHARVASALLGSVARGVLAKSRRPVLVVPPFEP